MKNSKNAAESIEAALDKEKTSIYLQSNQIVDISPLKGSLPSSLKELSLHKNQIVDISPLMGSLPSSLTVLNLFHNQIVDISPLQGSLPSSLKELRLSRNCIVDISPLMGSLPSSLTELSLSKNQIVDISPLTGSLPSSLTGLYLDNNPIADVNNAACAIAFNPLIFAILELRVDNDKIKSLVHKLGPKIQKLGPNTYSQQVPSNVIQSGLSAILSYLQNPAFKEVVALLLSLEISSQNAPTIAIQLDMNMYCSVNQLAQSPESVLKECGLRDNDLDAVLEWQRDKSATLDTLTPITYLLYMSYVKRDTVAEMGLFFTSATETFKDHCFFRDTEERFKLAELVNNVKQSTNVMVFLSQGYGKSPYCLVELVTAFQHHLNIITVIVHRPGLDLFNFEEMRNVLESGRVNSLLDEKGWKVVESAGYCQQDVVDALLAVMNVKAFPFHVDSTQRTQKAYLEDIWDGVKF